VEKLQEIVPTATTSLPKDDNATVDYRTPAQRAFDERQAKKVCQNVCIYLILFVVRCIYVSAVHILFTLVATATEN
jgi:hypothetical protein